MEVALDFAIQCSPDHPWLKEHPGWFKRRPDGSIRTAENPPKKYEDIVNPDFYCVDRIALWQALRDVVLFWVKQGVRIFRVDNPHTKPFPFWEWLIREVQARDPDVLFLSEAFSRPEDHEGARQARLLAILQLFHLAHPQVELREYLSEITAPPRTGIFRPNFFVSTPDILPVHLQAGEPWMFKSRLALAATLSSNYGIYNGFELLEHEPVRARGCDQFGTIRDQDPRLEKARQHQERDRPDQPAAAGKRRDWCRPAIFDCTGRRSRGDRLRQGIGRA